jgi:hypothetical protein
MAAREPLFLIALAITVVVETSVVLTLVRRVFRIAPAQLSLARCLFACCFASFATLPYLWFVLPAFVRSYPALVTTGELGVFALEAVAYVFLLGLPLRKTVVLSLVANLASVAVGFMVLPAL